nr:MAG TPA: hypothetical protein [Bacteriophage sp.]
MTNSFLYVYAIQSSFLLQKCNHFSTIFCTQPFINKSSLIRCSFFTHTFLLFII